jgi:hypothetical protein
MKQRLHRLLRNVPKPPTSAMRKQVQLMLEGKQPSEPYLLGDEWVVSYTVEEDSYNYLTVGYTRGTSMFKQYVSVTDTVLDILSYDSKEEPRTDIKTLPHSPKSKEIEEKDYGYNYKRYML